MHAMVMVHGGKRNVTHLGFAYLQSCQGKFPQVHLKMFFHPCVMGEDESSMGSCWGLRHPLIAHFGIKHKITMSHLETIERLPALMSSFRSLEKLSTNIARILRGLVCLIEENAAQAWLIPRREDEDEFPGRVNVGAVGAAAPRC